MRFTIDMKRFAAGFSLVSKGAAAADFSPALTCVLVTAQTDKTVILEATDTERGIRFQFDDVDVFAPGKVLLPVKLFSKILSANKGSSVIDLDTGDDKNGVEIRCDGSYYKIATNTADSFPELPAAEPDNCYVFTAQEIVDGYNCTNFAIDTENYRYALGGIYFQSGKTETGKDIVNLVSTDGRRLSQLELGVTVIGSPNDKPFIIPAKTFALAQQIARSGAIDVKVYLDNFLVYFDFGSVRLHSRLTDGRFPAWEKIMPPKKERIYQSFKTSILLTALKQASVLTSDNCPGVKLWFSGGKRLTLSVPDANNGSVEIEINPEQDSIGDTDIRSKIDPVLAIQYLSALPDESEVSVYLKDDNSSLLFESLDVDKAISNFILMPLA